MALEIGAHERAQDDDAQSALPRIGQREPGQRRADPATTELRRDLGMDERTPTALLDVLEDPHEVAVDVRLVAIRRRCVGYDRVHLTCSRARGLRGIGYSEGLGQESQSRGYPRGTMTDQLSLRLEPDRPVLPNLPDLRPMLPRPLPDAFDSPDHLFEPWWGGTRVLIHVGPADVPGTGMVRVMDESGRDVSESLPELAGLAVRVGARSAILDGELVVVGADGRADSAALAARLTGERDRPAAFLAFDLLHLDGRSLLGLPLVRRREMLRRTLRPGDEVVAVPAIATEGRALFEAIVAQGLAGMMARQRQADRQSP